MSVIDQVFVSHYSPLAERRRWLEPALEALGFQSQWVTTFDKRSLSRKAIAKHYSLDRELFFERARLGGAFGVPLEFRPLNMAEIANAITHIYFYQQIIQNNLETTLILEDDVVFRSDFRTKLEQYIEQLPTDWDILYPGSGCGLHIPQTNPRLNVYPNTKRESRTADCYVIRKEAARKILSTVIPFALPIDWELNYHQCKHALNVYWGEPSIAFQGSEIGLYDSSSNAKEAFLEI